MSTTIPRAKSILNHVFVNFFNSCVEFQVRNVVVIIYTVMFYSSIALAAQIISKTGEPGEIFTFSLNKRTKVTIETTGSLDTFLTLNIGKESIDIDNDMGENTNELYREELPAGNYSLTVGSYDSGNYQVTIKTGEDNSSDPTVDKSKCENKYVVSQRWKKPIYGGYQAYRCDIVYGNVFSNLTKTICKNGFEKRNDICIESDSSSTPFPPSGNKRPSSDRCVSGIAIDETEYRVIESGYAHYVNYGIGNA